MARHTAGIFVTELSLKTVDLFQLPQQSRTEVDARVLTGALFGVQKVPPLRWGGGEGGGKDEDGDIPNYFGRESGTEELRDK